MTATKTTHVKEPKNISGVDVIKFLALNFWHWTKDKVIHIIIVAVCGGLIIYLTTWATLPKTLNELKANQVKNEALIQQSIKKSDSIANQKVDKSDFQKEVILINNSMQHLDEKTDILYENLIGEKYIPVKK